MRVSCSWYLWQGWNDQVTVCLIIKSEFWEYRTRFDSKHFGGFFGMIIVFKVTHLWHPQKSDQQMSPAPPSHFQHPQKWTIDLMFKITESANTWQLLRTPLATPLLCKHHKCMFSFWFFKVWSATCLNANEILNFMKIQLSCLLSSYQRNQAYISNWISYFLNNFLVSLCQ